MVTAARVFGPRRLPEATPVALGTKPGAASGWELGEKAKALLEASRGQPQRGIGSSELAARVFGIDREADDERRVLKATLLRLVPKIFSGAAGVEPELRLRAEKIAERYVRHLSDPDLERAGLGAADGAKRKLAVGILGAFDRREQGEFSETGLRVSAMIALQEVGQLEDLAAAIPHLRKGNADDRSWALRTLERLARGDFPLPRDTLPEDPEIGPLLRADRTLTTEEQRTLIEAVLVRGKVIGVERSQQSKNFNETYFVTFEEKLDGRHIRGVYKPEPPPGENHEETQSSREVLAYELDARFLKTSLVPPTAEVVFSVDGGRSFRLGSMQYFLPEAHDLGTSRLERDAEWNTYRSTSTHDLERDRATLLRYLYDDVDHNREPDGYGDRNTMLQRGAGGLHRKMIDFGNSFGLRPAWSRAIVNARAPRLDAETKANLRSAPLAEVAAVASQWVQPRFVAELIARFRQVAADLG